MSPVLSTVLGAVFLLAGAVAVVSMMARMGTVRASPPESLRRIHRISGWAFTGLYAGLFAAMTPRIHTYWEESSPRVSLHIALAVGLIVLLGLKLSVAKVFKALGKHLFLLGAGLYAASFIMVLTTGGYQALRSAAGTPRISRATLPDSLYDGRLGLALFTGKCSACHPLEAIATPRPAESWERSINHMMRLAGSRIATAEAAQILHYLSATRLPGVPAGAEASSPLVKYCAACHKPEALTSWRNNESGWRSIVMRMREYDPRAVPEDKVEEIVAYLTRTQGPRRP